MGPCSTSTSRVPEECLPRLQQSRRLRLQSQLPPLSRRPWASRRDEPIERRPRHTRDAPRLLGEQPFYCDTRRLLGRPQFSYAPQRLRAHAPALRHCHCELAVGGRCL